MYICNKRRVPKLVLIRQQIFCHHCHNSFLSCIERIHFSWPWMCRRCSLSNQCVSIIETAGCYLQSVLMPYFQALIDVRKMPLPGVSHLPASAVLTVPYIQHSTVRVTGGLQWNLTLARLVKKMCIIYIYIYICAAEAILAKLQGWYNSNFLISSL